MLFLIKEVTFGESNCEEKLSTQGTYCVTCPNKISPPYNLKHFRNSKIRKFTEQLKN